MAGPEFFSYPDLSLKPIALSDSYAELVQKVQYNFDQIYSHGGGPRGLPGDKGDKGNPGATTTGETGADGKRGSIIHFYNGVLADLQLVSTVPNPTQYAENDVVLDNNYVHFSVLINTVGAYYFKRRLGLLGPEDIGNKATDMTTLNNTLYPTTLAVSNYVGVLVTGMEVTTNKATDFTTVNNTKYPSVQAVSNYAEALANKATDFTTVNNTKYPSVQAVSNYAEALANKATDWSTVNNTKYPTVQAVDNQKMDKRISFVTAGGDYTVQLTDAGKCVSATPPTPLNITLDSSLGFAPGDQILFEQNGAGQITFLGGGGDTIISYASANKTAGQYAGATAIFKGASTWWLTGQIVP